MNERTKATVGRCNTLRVARPHDDAMDRPKVCEGTCTIVSSLTTHSTSRQLHMTAQSHHPGCASHGWSAGHPRYTRVQYAGKAVGCSTATRNTDTRVDSTRMTRDIFGRIPVSLLTFFEVKQAHKQKKSHRDTIFHPNNRPCAQQTTYRMV